MIKSIQSLLVLSFALWACLPFYGAAAVLAAVLLLLGAAFIQVRSARSAVEPFLDALTLSDEAKSWTRRFAPYFLKPAEAMEWAATFKLAGLLCLLTAIWFIARALLTWQLWLLWVSVGLVVVLPLFGNGGLWFDPNERVESISGKAQRAIHEEASRLLSLKRVTGQWPPVPNVTKNE